MTTPTTARRGGHVLPHQSQMISRDLHAEKIARHLGATVHGYRLTPEQVDERHHSGPGLPYEFLIYVPGSPSTNWTAFYGWTAFAAWCRAYGIDRPDPLPGTSFTFQLPESIDAFQSVTWPVTAQAVVGAYTWDGIAYPDPVARSHNGTVNGVWHALVEAVGVETATRQVLALNGGADALTGVWGSPYPITWDESLDITDPEQTALLRHLEHDHGWEMMDGVFTFAQARAMHAQEHEQESGLLTESASKHAADDLSTDSALPWAHIDIDMHGEWQLRTGGSVIGRVTARTADTLTIGAGVEPTSVWAITGFHARRPIHAS